MEPSTDTSKSGHVRLRIMFCIRKVAARTSLELAGDIGKHSQSQRNYEQNLAEMTPEELSAIIDRWEGEKAAIAKDITPV